MVFIQPFAIGWHCGYTSRVQNINDAEGRAHKSNAKIQSKSCQAAYVMLGVGKNVIAVKPKWLVAFYHQYLFMTLCYYLPCKAINPEVLLKDLSGMRDIVFPNPILCGISPFLKFTDTPRISG